MQSEASQGKSAGSDMPESKGPLTVLLYPEMDVWNELRQLVADTDKHQAQSARVASKDPAIVLELLRAANALALSEGKPPITMVARAIVRIGSEAAIARLEDMKERDRLTDESHKKWYELGKNRCYRTAEVAAAIAEPLARNLVDDIHCAGLLYNVADLVCVMHMKDQYVKLAEENSRSKLLYRLEKDHDVNLEKMSVNYLRRFGIPEGLIFAIDRTMQTKTPSRAPMKPIVAAAVEMVNAFDAGRWERIGPDGNLPPKSAIRMLQMNDRQYEGVYEKAGEILNKLNPEQQEQ